MLVESVLFSLGLGGGVRPTVEAQMEDSVEFVMVLVEMYTETPQSQRSIETQNMLTNMLHLPASIRREDQVMRTGPPAVWSPCTLSP